MFINMYINSVGQNMDLKMYRLSIIFASLLIFVGCGKSDTSQHHEFNRPNGSSMTINDRLNEARKENLPEPIDAIINNRSSLNKYGKDFPAINTLSKAQEEQNEKVRILKLLSSQTRDLVLQKQARDLLQGMRGTAYFLMDVVKYYYDNHPNETGMSEINVKLMRYSRSHYKYDGNIINPDIRKHINYFTNNIEKFEKSPSNLAEIQTYFFTRNYNYSELTDGEMVVEFSTPEEVVVWDKMVEFIWNRYGYNEDQTKFGLRESFE